MGGLVRHPIGEHCERVVDGNPQAIPSPLVKSSIFTPPFPKTRGSVAVWVVG